MVLKMSECRSDCDYPSRWKNIFDLGSDSVGVPALMPQSERRDVLDSQAAWRIHNKLEHQQHHYNTMLVSLTVGKVDAGVAVLLTEDKRLVRYVTQPQWLDIGKTIWPQQSD